MSLARVERATQSLEETAPSRRQGRGGFGRRSANMEYDSITGRSLSEARRGVEPRFTILQTVSFPEQRAVEQTAGIEPA